MKKHRKRRSAYKKKHNLKTYFMVTVLALLVTAATFWVFRELSAQKPANVWYEAQSASVEGGRIHLPKDDAPHQGAKTEWWSYHGRLSTDSGKQYEFTYTTFLLADAKGHGISHVLFNDFQTGQHYVDQFQNSVSPAFGMENTFYFSTGERSMQGSNGTDHLRVIAKDFAFDLNLENRAEPILQGKNGVIAMGEDAGNSYAYSRTHLAITGSVTIDGKIEAVDGVAWFEHLWGDFWLKKLAWDCFAFRLADGADVQLYQLRDKAYRPLLASGTITQNGITESLSSADFSLTPKGKWTGVKTGIGFPIEWQLKIPGKHIDVTTRSLIKNNEIDARPNLGIIYWVGAMDLQGTQAGRGFMRLYGYTDKR